ncbi:MAG: ABC transporter substrate-binding protein [Solirubrobacterales bacterium]
MRRNLSIFGFIAVISLIIGSVIFYFVGINGREDVKLSGKITVLADSGDYNAVLEAANNFKKLHNRIEINVIKDDNTYNKISEEIKAAKFKEDMAIISEDNAGDLFKQSDSSFLELSGYSSDFSDGRLGAITYNKKVLGIPWSSEPVMILYRSDIFSSEGINIDDIKTWDDFRAIGKNLTIRTGKKFLAYNSSEFTKVYQALLSQLRISYVDKINNTRVSDLINEMVYEGTLYGSDSIINLAKKEGTLAIIAKPKDAYKLMEVTELKGKWGVMKIPAFEPGGNRDVSLGGKDLLINKNTKNINLSKEFAKYLSSDRSTVYLNLEKHGIFSANYTVYEGEQFNTNEYFNTNIWSLYSDVEKNAPENKYK